MNVEQLKIILQACADTIFTPVSETEWQFSIDRTPLGTVWQDGNTFHIGWRKYGFATIHVYKDQKEIFEQFYYTGFLGDDCPILQCLDDFMPSEGEIVGVFPRRWSGVSVVWDGVSETGEWDWDTHMWDASQQDIIMDENGLMDEYPEWL